ncbi:hypothetical protein D9M68_695090 [compost metagenome]
MTLGEQQLAVKLLVLGTFELQLGNALAVEAFQLNIQAVVENLEPTSVIRVTEYATTMVEIALELHVTNGAQAVKPAVSRLLHGRGKAHLFDLFHQCGARANDAGRERAVADQGQIAFLLQRLDTHAGDAGFADAEQRRALGHGGDKDGARLGGVAFDVIGVHAGFP